MRNVLTRLSRVSLILISCFLSLPSLFAQVTVAPVTGWLATVDEATQQIVLSWHPSTDPQTMGYHICTGTPCLDYDTVFGRLDTSFVCLDHDATEPHTYRIHVFDSTYDVSSLTPSFGNIVLTAEVPRCSSTVNASWTPYRGMPGGIYCYRLKVRLEPFDDDYRTCFTTDSTGPFTYSFTIPDSTTRVWLKLQAESFGDIHNGHPLVSQSNLVHVERLTVDTAAFLSISGIEYDSIHWRNILSFDIDTAYHSGRYTLYRSVDGSPWDSIATLLFAEPPFTYVDSDINIYDSLHCYRLEVPDACNLNPRSSDTLCIVVPMPPDPAWAFPNVIIVGDPVNGTFLPRLRGLKGDLYELFIYNRFGLLVYSTEDPLAGWTPSADTPQDAYAYALRCRFNNNRVKIFTGSVLVIK